MSEPEALALRQDSTRALYVLCGASDAHLCTRHAVPGPRQV